MKKLFTTAALGLCLSASVFAQDDDYSSGEGSAFDNKSKRGINILPEAGDYALGVDAIPFLDAVSTLFSFAPAGSPTFEFPANGLAIQGKYFVYDDQAYRGRVRIGYDAQTQKALVNEIGTTSTPPDQVEDKFTNTEIDIELAAGIEKRRGHGRVQGLYGAMAMISYSSESDKFTYGNDMDATNNDASLISNNFNGNAAGVNRTLKESYGSTFGIGVLGFVGVEYFFAPKISLGGEFTWGPEFSTTGKGKVETEGDGVGGNPGTIETIETETAGAGSFVIDTDNIGGSIFLNFHF